jgi:hypothetical protein
MRALSTLAGLAFIGAVLPAHAQAPTPAPPAAPAPAPDMARAAPASDKENYLSDKIKFQFATTVLRVDMTALTGDKPATPACAPAYTTFKGIGNLQLGAVVHPAFRVTQVPEEDKSKARCTGTPPLVREDDVVIVKAAEITGTPPDRYGLTYGTLLVPYKYQLKGDRSLSGKASIGGYLGFRQDRSGWTGLALQYVAFVGASSISVAQTVDGSPVTQDMTGLSYGLALLGTVKEAFQLGVVIGADRVNRNAHYVNNGKPWVAVSLGFDFSN